MVVPLALGRPNHIVNAFYRKAKKDKSIKLKIVTALPLGHLKGKSLLESRFIEPFSERLFEAKGIQRKILSKLISSKFERRVQLELLLHV